MRPLIATDGNADGGVLWGGSFRAGRTLPGISGLELRAGLDIFGGAAGGFALAGGAVYMFGPIGDLPLFVGPSLEIGYFQQLSGAQVPAFLARVSPVIAFRITDQLQIEAALPELQLITSNSGALSLGGGIRLGYRF